MRRGIGYHRDKICASGQKRFSSLFAIVPDQVLWGKAMAESGSTNNNKPAPPEVEILKEIPLSILRTSEP